MKILVLNSGSSSIKFKFFNMTNNECIASGLVEEIGTANSRAEIFVTKNDRKLELNDQSIQNHNEGIDVVNYLLKETEVLNSLDEIDGVGHRIVQGADYFDKAVLVDDDVIEKIRELCPLAPLHNPANLAGILSSLEHKPDLPNVAVFDTVFHQTMPEHVYMYALPYEFYTEYKVRRYGAHGTSHGYVANAGAKFLGIDNDKFNCITLHLGNGSSVTAVKDGKCYDTSMGLTPLEGLIMGTRCGSIDPAIIPYMERVAGFDAQQMDTIMNKKSGLLGISGTSDLRKVTQMMEDGDKLAKLAFDMLVYRIIKTIGEYYAVLGRVDAIIFTAGIGENAANLREAVCKKLEHMGISIDLELNNKREKDIRDISTKDAKIKTLIIPTNEELAIAIETQRLISK
ncbi:acetate kinase [Campylobacter geochelonis]|uniref:Acetate kinase n=1 Tax=Campylobacter geochelonis TaxID=1780362 RepID=A0A128EPM0_9BACT|nr:acetate kinase [Campylobacter geochelonis]QKF71316.1 acetate kinase [Campylobacter geochelonis]CZE48057.1 acetate kinase [Campylobacter geochelonis]CZE48194.1 acetate kinase [Campylobacter geochelonis]CZE51066.1 acetate kinase [Campylobacter geochelonis]